MSTTNTNTGPELWADLILTRAETEGPVAVGDHTLEAKAWGDGHRYRFDSAGLVGLPMSWTGRAVVHATLVTRLSEHLEAAAGLAEATAPDTSPAPLLRIALDRLHPSRLNPRQTVTDDDLADLADSLKAHGLLQPLLVRPIGADGYELVCGHRRHAAAQLAGLDALDCRVKAMTDAQVIEAALVENSARRSVPPLEESNALIWLVDAGESVADLTERLGRSRKWVRDRLALRGLHPQFRRMMGTGMLTLRSGVALAALPLDQQEPLCQQLGEGGTWQRRTWPHHDVFCAIRRQSKELSRAPWSLKRQGLAGKCACTECPLQTGRQPDLWMERVDEATRCLEQGCWDAKRAAWLEERKAEGATVSSGDYWVGDHLNVTDAAEGLPPWGEVFPDLPRVIFDNSWRVFTTIARSAAVAVARGRGDEALLAALGESDTPTDGDQTPEPTDEPEPTARELAVATFAAEVVEVVEALDVSDAVGKVLAWRLGEFSEWDCTAVAKRREWRDAKAKTRRPIVGAMSPAERLALWFEVETRRHLDVLGHRHGGAPAPRLCRALASIGLQVPDALQPAAVEPQTEAVAS